MPQPGRRVGASRPAHGSDDDEVHPPLPASAGRCTVALVMLLGAAASFTGLHGAQARRRDQLTLLPAASPPVSPQPASPARADEAGDAQRPCDIVAAPGKRPLRRQDAARPLPPDSDPFRRPTAVRRPAGQPLRPNIILLLADDLGWADVNVFYQLTDDSNGPGVAKPPSTPALDKMAAEGTSYTSFYVSSPVCSASRATFMTGQWPTSPRIRLPYIYANAHENNAQKGQSDFLNKSVPNVPTILRTAGYVTGHFGKWHLGGTLDAPAVSDYGFDESVTFASNARAARRKSTMLSSSQPPWKDATFPSSSSRMIVDRLIGFAERTADDGKPFYANAWFHVAHAPLNPTAKQLEPFPRATYCPASGMFPSLYAKNFSTCPIQVYHAAILDMDTQVGRLLDVLRGHKQMRLREETLVVYTSDNGPEDEQVYFNSKGQTGMFRGRKRSLYEGGTRVPAIAWWPGRVRKGAFTAADFTAFDWLPTVASLAGAAIPEALQGRCDRGECLAGRDASRLLVNPDRDVPRSIPLLWDYRFKILGPCSSQSPRVGIREGDLKLLVHHDLTRIEMYNTTLDNSEARNIVAEHPAAAERMSQVALAWLRTQSLTPGRQVVLNRGCMNPTRRLITLTRGR